MAEKTGLENAREAVAGRIAEIERQLGEMTALQAERDRLHEALRLLGDEHGETRPHGARRAPTAKRRAKTPTAPRRGRSTNRDAVLAHLREHPDVEAGSIVEALGVSRGVAYNLLGRLVQQGVLERSAGPAGRSVYRTAGGGAAGTDA